MGTLDTYTADFPHGTPDGFDKGCRSAGGCPNKGDVTLQTCKTAKQRSRSDASYQRLIKSGAGPELLALNEENLPTIGAPKPSPTPNPALAVQPVELGSTATDDGIPLELHGTTKGYNRGCRRSDCPGIDQVGKSCRTAATDYQRVKTAERKAAAAAGVTKARASIEQPAQQPAESEDVQESEVVVTEWLGGRINPSALPGDTAPEPDAGNDAAATLQAELDAAKIQQPLPAELDATDTQAHLDTFNDIMAIVALQQQIAQADMQLDEADRLIAAYRQSFTETANQVAVRDQKIAKLTAELDEMRLAEFNNVAEAIEQGTDLASRTVNIPDTIAGPPTLTIVINVGGK